MDSRNPLQPSSEASGGAANALDTLRRDYVVIGRAHIKPWQAWLILGLAAGVAAGLFLVANRSGEVEEGKAASSGPYQEDYSFPSSEAVRLKDVNGFTKIQQLSAGIPPLAAKISAASGSERTALIEQLRQALKTRRQAIETELSQDPVAAFASFFPPAFTSQLPPEVQGGVEQPVTLQATIEVFHTDDFSKQIANFRYFLRQGQKKLEFYPVGNQLAILSGSTVRVDGFQIGDKVVASIGSNTFQVLSAATPQAIGDQKTLAILITFLDSPPPPFTLQEGQKLVFQDQVQAFYKETSYGQISWSGDVLGWHTVPRNGMANGQCQWPVYGNDFLDPDGVLQYINASGLNFSDYKRIVLISNHLCMGGGFASLGMFQDLINGQTITFSTAWVGAQSYNSSFGQHPFPWRAFDYVLSHELGHNLGVMHANHWECGPSRILYGPCLHSEYGNSFDTMGSGGHAIHFNGSFKDAFGWLSNFSQTISQSGTYALSPLEATSSGSRVARIQPPFLKSPPFYLEYRRAIGFDRGLSLEPYTANQYGLFVNWVPSYQWAPASRLLDMSPVGDSYPDWAEVVLTPGLLKTFQDKGRGVTIGPVWVVDPNKITFQVWISPPQCVANTPYEEAYPSVFYNVATSSQTFPSVQVQNYDSPTCPPSDFAVSIEVPQGWTYAITGPSLFTLQPDGDSGYSSFEVDIPATAAIGNYTVQIGVKNVRTGKINTKPVLYQVGTPNSKP